MFTGIVEELGTVLSLESGRMTVGASRVLDGVALGDSIAVNGCCLTVVAHDEGSWEADLSEETLRRTALSALAPGSPANLERAVRADQRMGGHIVQGHVDGDGALPHEVALEARGNPHTEVGNTGDHRADAVDVPLDDVASHALVGAHRAFEVGG